MLNRNNILLDQSRRLVLEAIYRGRSLLLRLKYGEVAPQPHQILFIDPSAVKYIIAPRFHADFSHRSSYVIDGDWDIRESENRLYFAGSVEPGYSSSSRSIVPINDFVFYQSCCDRYHNGMRWEETEFYQWLLENLDKKIPRYENEVEITERLAFLDSLYDTFCNSGYKSQHKLSSSARSTWYDEVLIDIGRDGQLILDDGRHRLILAKLAGIRELPVRILVRHEEWQETRTKVANANFNNIEDFPFDEKHPDLKPLVNEDH